MPELPPPPPDVDIEFVESLAPERQRDDDRRTPRVDPGEEPADFDFGDTDVKFRFAFSGSRLGPQTLLTSFFNWFEVQAFVDTAVYQEDRWTLGIGAEVGIGRPFIPEGISELSSDADVPLAWRATSRTLSARASAHYTGLSTFDPYLVGIVGPTLDSVYARRPDRVNVVGRRTSAGLRFGAGAGVNIVTADRVTGGLELRYLGGTRFRSGADIPIIDQETGSTVDQFSIGKDQRMPRGFSWVVSIGVRL